MKWTLERTHEGRFEIRTETGLSALISSLPDRGESDEGVRERSQFVLDAINEKLAAIGAVEPDADPATPDVDGEDSGLDAPKTKRGKRG